MNATRALLRLDFVEELMSELNDATVTSEPFTKGLNEEQEAAIYRAWVAIKEAKEALEKTLGQWPCVGKNV